MKTKKSGAYAALAAVLLISAVLITNCVDPINPGGLFVPKDKDQPAFVPPPGKGYVRLNFGAGRTIRPAAGDFVTNIADYKKIDVRFTVVTGEDGTPLNPPAFESDTTGENMKTAYEKLSTYAFAVDAGIYDVEVWAYKNSADTSISGAIAYGISSTALTVVDGEANTASITLREITVAQSGGTGTFKLNLTNATATTSYTSPAQKITMTITSWPGGDGTGITDEVIYDPTATMPDPDDDDPPIADIPLNKLGIYSTPLPPGIYRVELTLTGAKMETKKIGEVLHLYQGMTSTYTGTLPSLSRNIMDVKFTYGDGRSNDGRSKNGSAPTEEVSYGDAVSAPTGTLAENNDGLGTKVIEGWYTNENFTGSKYVFSTKVIRDFDLWANWETIGIYVTVTNSPNSTGHDPLLSVVDNDDDSPITGLISLDSLPEIRIFFNNTAGYYSGISWECDIDDITPLIDSTASSITIDLADADYIKLLQVTGTGPNDGHTITVNATYDVSSSDDIDALPVSAFIRIRIAQ